MATYMRMSTWLSHKVLFTLTFLIMSASLIRSFMIWNRPLVPGSTSSAFFFLSTCSRTDSSMFILCKSHDILILLLYMDEIIFTGSSFALLYHIIYLLSIYPLSDEGPWGPLLFSRVQVVRTPYMLFLLQSSMSMIFSTSLTYPTTNLFTLHFLWGLHYLLLTENYFLILWVSEYGWSFAILNYD